MTQARITHVFFDAGGTIIEIEYENVRQVLRGTGAGGGREACSVDGIPADAAFAAAERPARAWFLKQVEEGVPDDIWWLYFRRILEGAGVEPEVIPAALERLWTVNVERGLWQRAAPGATAVLAALRAADYSLSVISNSEGRVARDIALAGLGHHFETVVDSHLVGVSKPDPRIFEIALERTGAEAARSVYVGDIYAIDVVGAKRAGLTPILLDRWRLQLDRPCRRMSASRLARNLLRGFALAHGHLCASFEPGEPGMQLHLAQHERNAAAKHRLP